MNTYLVKSPTYADIIPVLGPMQGPVEFICDVVIVRARNRTEARLTGRKLMEKAYPQGYIARQRKDGLYPYTGLKVEEAPDEDWKHWPAEFRAEAQSLVKAIR